MRIFAALSVLWVLAGLPLTGQESSELPFYLPTPDGWRTETIPFPLDFAPELDYEGLEELRFSPGMFIEMKVDFWSYAFVWWVPEDTVLDAERLQTDLEIYFRGLTRAVAETREFDPGEPDFEVQLSSVESSPPDQASWEGTVRTFDVFTTRRPIRLRTRIDILRCPEQGRLAAFFQFSPQPVRNRIWEVMEDMRQGFRCEP